MMKPSRFPFFLRVRRVLRVCRLSARLLAVFPVRLYQWLVSPVFPPSCRFTPTCSAYAIEAVMTHGVFKGVTLAAWRLLRCNPWSAGGFDPVPPLRPSLRETFLLTHSGPHAAKHVPHPTQESLTYHGR